MMNKRGTAKNTIQLSAFSIQRFLADQRGQYALLMIFAIALFLLIIGLIVDMGLFLREFRRAQNAFDAAAQAAAQTADPLTLQQTGQVVLSADAASVAQTYANLNIYSGDKAWSTARVTSVQVTPANAVVVKGTAGMRTPFFLSMFGFGRLTVHVTGAANPAFGISTQTQ